MMQSPITHSARASLDGCAGQGPDLSQFKVAIQHKRFNPQKIIRHQCQCWVYPSVASCLKDVLYRKFKRAASDFIRRNAEPGGGLIGRRPWSLRGEVRKIEGVLIRERAREAAQGMIEKIKRRDPKLNGLLARESEFLLRRQVGCGIGRPMHIRELIPAVLPDLRKPEATAIHVLVIGEVAARIAGQRRLQAHVWRAQEYRVQYADLVGI